MVTNLRVCLLQRQPCPCQAKQPGTAALPTRHYAIYHFILNGSCLCHGHAEQCVPGREEPQHGETAPSWLVGVAASAACVQVRAAAGYQTAALATIPGIEGFNPR